MKIKLHFALLFLFGSLIHGISHAQENGIDVEESAEVFLEEYSDEFQETFFEALKQKGIENYDRAINLLLKCKNIDPSNEVVDHELAKAHLAANQPILGLEYAINAVTSKPENLWYLSTLVNATQKQGTTVEAVGSQIPFDNTKLKENLALIYYKKREYKNALNILNGIKKSPFTEDLTLKINDSIKQLPRQVTESPNETPIEPEINPIEELREQMEDLISANDFVALEKASMEAMESFPSQPYFYYINGLALNTNGKPKAAIDVLEMALDYMLDDVDLSNKIYGELAKAYRTLGNTSKATLYLDKIKSGS